jgi:hypothetical protein
LALRESLNPDGSEEALPPELAEDARRYLEEITATLGRLPLTLSPEGTSLAIDGRPLVVDPSDPTTVVAGIAAPGEGAPLPTGVAALLIDPGAHVIVLSRKGSPDHVIRKSVDRGARGPAWELFLPEVEPDVPAPRAAAPGRAGGIRDQAPSPTPDRTLAYVALGAGALGAITGSVFGVLALNEYDDLEAACPRRRCSPLYEDDLDRLELHANLATLGFIVAGAGGALGLTLLFSETKPAKDTAVRAVIGPGSVAIDGRF